MKSVKTLGVAILLSTLSVAAFAGDSNGADGWRKLQDQQSSQQPAPQSERSQASADAFAAQAIAANPSNYNVR